MFAEQNGKTGNQTNRHARKLIGAQSKVFGIKRKLPLVVIFCWAIFIVFALYFPTAEASSPILGLNERAAEAESPEEFVFEEFVSENSAQFSRFTHTNAAHRSVSCLLCHQRNDNSARIRRSGHSPCIGCHSQEFANSESKICTICHTNPSAGASSVKAFPPLRSFNAKFDHAVHNRRGATPRQGCATCHKPAQRGSVARSIPAGLNAHATCFQCHTNRAQVGGRDISSCGTCHSFGRLTRTPETARAFRLGFSHAEHSKTACLECHQVRAGARGNQVTATTPAMHFPPARAQSCASCHNNSRVFGGNDFSDCRRCHTGNTFGL